MIAPFFLLFAIVAFRILSAFSSGSDFSWISNFSPLAAVALCSAVYLPKRFAFFLPLAALWLSDLCINTFHYHQPPFSLAALPAYAALALIAAIGLRLRSHPSTISLLLATIAGSTLFFLFTNSAAWLAEPAYPKSLAGWLQSLTTGLPAYPPTWLFFRNSLLSDSFFTLLFITSLSLCSSKNSRLAPTPSPATR